MNLFKHITLDWCKTEESTFVIAYKFNGHHRKLIRDKDECDIIGDISQYEALELAEENERELAVKVDAAQLMDNAVANYYAK